MAEQPIPVETIKEFYVQHLEAQNAKLAAENLEKQLSMTIQQTFLNANVNIHEWSIDLKTGVMEPRKTDITPAVVTEALPEAAGQPS